MPTTIYFSGSITGGRADAGLYRAMVESLESRGFRVLAGSVAAETVGDAGDPLDPRFIFDRDVAWLAEADVLVAEVSTPSLGVGYEIAAARYRFGIPVICLWRPAYTKRCSAMLAGDPAVTLLEYREDGLAELLEKLANKLQTIGVSPRASP